MQLAVRPDLPVETWGVEEEWNASCPLGAVSRRVADTRRQKGRAQKNDRAGWAEMLSPPSSSALGLY